MDSRELRERLLRAEPPQSAFRERYEREVREMFDRKLSARQKVIRIAGIVLVSSVVAAVWAYLESHMSGEAVRPVRWFLRIFVLLIGLGMLLINRRIERTELRIRDMFLAFLAPSTETTVDAPQSEKGERHEREIRETMERKLSAPGKVVFAVVEAVMLGTAGLCGWLAVHRWESAPPLALVGLGVGVLFALASAAMIADVLRRGSIDRLKLPRRVVGLAWVFIVAMVTIFMLATGRTPDAVRSVYTVAYGLVFLVMAAVFLIVQRIEQAELKTREKLLELELRLAEIAELLRRDK